MTRIGSVLCGALLLATVGTLSACNNGSDSDADGVPPGIARASSNAAGSPTGTSIESPSPSPSSSMSQADIVSDLCAAALPVAAEKFGPQDTQVLNNASGAGEGGSTCTLYDNAPANSRVESVQISVSTDHALGGMFRAGLKIDPKAAADYDFDPSDDEQVSDYFVDAMMTVAGGEDGDPKTHCVLADADGYTGGTICGTTAAPGVTHAAFVLDGDGFIIVCDHEGESEYGVSPPPKLQGSAQFCTDLLDAITN